MFASLRKGSYPNTGETSVDDRSSEIARGAALLRALAALDEREEIRGGDYLAEIFLNENRQGSLKEPAIRDWLVRNYLPYGVYAYAIARTAYFDHIMEQALRDNIPQIVILAAGYDSRPYRFRELIGKTRIFELDDEATQKRKRELLKQANIPIPEQVTYVPVADDNETLENILPGAGFDGKKLTLFIFEGISYYLQPSEVDEIFNFIKTHSPAGSSVCFDYGCISPGGPATGEADDLPQIMAPAGSAETTLFGIEEGKSGIFLAKRELMTLEHLTAEELEKRFLTLRDGSLAGRVPARFCVVYASLSG